ncbi:UDP-N-acetylmuramoyl-tripeptide--D-alanyl-D-alanine ligase [Peptoniphilus stercorisuis]|uniref:UDP-N-acetylmuramoyl-tripeptide--D-alanyl-D-alanine ligase n=1 Tax=Peptoniphilus stercorisuis TaxID=1436965 RepID=A0ABS4KDR0_9FIRM|nr:UDP-N-acetylmuramoyl-tripeptide--D-alanyl-D-alanine ligase [Peptoniphilus stercorisuis]MBP2025892.1 UDP-N-acetylmuramoyl-tripeptide--D-alanyl-D-alanine ligase [Peptoniphilus stercorisuis]
MVILLIIEFVIVATSYYFSVIRSNYPLHMLQLEGYNNEDYKTWIKNNKSKVSKFVYKKTEEKTPLVWTDRAKRLFKIHDHVNLAFLVGFIMITDIIYANTKSYYSTIVLVILCLILYYFEYRVILISNKISVPREEKINMGFFVEAQGKIKNLKENNNLKVLGITGSFGKTSTKFIADTILSESLNVKNTPSSYNTPMGLSKVINNDLNESHEVFLAELGAKMKGEIDEVAQLVQPDIGIITAIGPTHMHMFKTIENIMNTKYELIEDLPEDGIAIFNYDNEYVKVLADKTEKKTIRYGMEDIEKLDVYAKDIEVSEKGSEFTLVIKELGEVKCSTKLLGKHNISNLLAAASAGYVLGMDLKSLASGIEKVEPVEHRLNIVDSGTGVIVIDDAFNSNPVGFRAALSVIDEFKNGRKIIITPGMVELGDMEEDENYKIGKEIAKVCDYVILVGKKRTEPIMKGLKDASYNIDNTFVVNSLNEATEVLGSITRSGDVVLFENDLPDTYSEE